MILIITTSDDLHGLCIHRELIQRGYANASLFFVDSIANNNELSINIGGNDDCVALTDSSGRRFHLSEVNLIWLRRLRIPDRERGNSVDQNTSGFISAEARGATTSVVNLANPARWISEPNATFRASDKLYQLSVAKMCGFKVPATLVSQSKEEVIEFSKQFNRPIVVKPIVGTYRTFLLTRFLEHPSELDELAYRACPAIYQEYIPGVRHLRLNCFGPDCYAALLQSAELDWRPNLNIPISSFNIAPDLQVATRKVLDALGLDMGIVDIKITPDDDYVWLEVNPQGQFLFLDALTDLHLKKKFADYLLDSVQNARACGR